MNNNQKHFLPFILLLLIFTLYSFLYIAIIWFDYFNMSNIHVSVYLFYPFVILGTLSLISSFPLYNLLKRRLTLNSSNYKEKYRINLLKKNSTLNIMVVILNIIGLTIWIIFIAGPGV